MMDHEIRTKILGVQEVELDDLPIDEEVTQQVQFGDVSEQR